MYVGLDAHTRVCYGTMTDEEGPVVKRGRFSNTRGLVGVPRVRCPALGVGVRLIEGAWRRSHLALLDGRIGACQSTHG